MRPENNIKPFLLTRTIIALFLIISLIPLGVMAGATITWVDNDILGSQSLIIKSANGTLLGTYNTTADMIILSDNESYIFQLRPKRTDYLRAPGALLTEIFGYVADNAIYLIFIGFLCLFLVYRRRS